MEFGNILQSVRRQKTSPVPSAGRSDSVIDGESTGAGSIANSRIIPGMNKSGAENVIPRPPVASISWTECKHLMKTGGFNRCKQFVCICKEDACPKKFRTR